MTTFDKVLHMLGAGAAGVAITGATGGLAIPAWLMIVCIGVAFATGTITSPIKGLFGKPTEPPKS